MGEKIGDVFDSGGNRIGSVWSSDSDGGAGCFLGGIVVIVGLVALIVYVVGWGWKVAGNVIQYGVWTDDRRTALIDSHRQSDTFFADYFHASDVSLRDVKIETERRGDGFGSTATISFNVSNPSNDQHVVQVSVGSVRAAVDDGPVQVLQINCDIGPGRSITVPAHGSVEGGECWTGGRSDITGPDATIVTSPAIIALDGMPITGGPANTPYCYSSNGPDYFSFVPCPS